MDTFEYFDPAEVFNNPTLLNLLVSRATRLLRNDRDARDAVVDVLISLKGRRINDIQSLMGYLLTCVSNKCFELLNKRNRMLELPESSRQDVAEDDTESKHFAMVAKIYPDVMDLLRKVCTREQYEVFEYWINGKHYDEIANIKNMTVGAVGSVLHRAKIKARSLASKVRRMMDNLED